MHLYNKDIIEYTQSMIPNIEGRFSTNTEIWVPIQINNFVVAWGKWGLIRAVFSGVA